MEEGEIIAVIANNQPLAATKDLQKAIGKRRCRNLSTAMLQWCMENTLVLFPGNAFSPATQGEGFTFKQKLPCAQRNRDTSSPDCGIGEGAQWGERFCRQLMLSAVLITPALLCLLGKLPHWGHIHPDVQQGGMECGLFLRDSSDVAKNALRIQVQFRPVSSYYLH